MYTRTLFASGDHPDETILQVMGSITCGEVVAVYRHDYKIIVWGRGDLEARSINSPYTEWVLGECGNASEFTLSEAESFEDFLQEVLGEGWEPRLCGNLIPHLLSLRHEREIRRTYNRLMGFDDGHPKAVYTLDSLIKWVEWWVARLSQAS